MQVSSFAIKRLVPALVIGLAAGSAWAVNPKKIPLSEGVTLTPTLDVDGLYDDNIYQSGTVEESSFQVNVAPSLLLEAVQGTSVYQLGYTLNSEFYQDSAGDDHVDHHLWGSANWGFTRASRLGLNASYDRVESLANTAVIGENDKLERTHLEAIYGLGVPAGRMNLDLGVNHTQFRTFNSGGINAGREYDKPGASAVLYYRLSPKTRALAEYRYDTFDYEQAGSLQDSDQHSYMLGLTWTATAQTVGTVKVGRQERDFDDGGLSDRERDSWMVDVTWQPSPRDTVALFTGRSIEDGSFDVPDNLVDATRYGVSWDHQFTPRMYSTLSYDFAEEDYLGLVGREDEVTDFGASVALDLHRQLTMSLGYQYRDRDSNQAARDFDRNLYMLNLDLSF